MTTYLGLDIGTASVGFCLLERDEKSSDGRIIRSGVRIFPEALEGKSEESKKPRNVTRRDMRLRRRQTTHGKLTRRLIRELLHGAGLLSSPEPAHNTKGDNKNEQPNHLYKLRERALTERIEPTELGRLLRHLAQRTGFAGSPKQAMGRTEFADGAMPVKEAEISEQEKEEETVKEEIANLESQLGKDTTLGSYLAGQETQRNRHIGQDMVRRELHQILNAQKQYHPTLLTDDFCSSLEKTMFYRRAIFWRWKSLGKCRYEPSSPLPMKADWHSQQFIMLETLNNIRLVGGNQRPLSDEERQILRDLMMSSAKVTFDAMRKELKSCWERTGTDINNKFNFEVGADKKKDLPGNATEALLKKVLGDGWEENLDAIRIRSEIAQQKWEIEYEKTLKGYRESHKGIRVEIKNYNQIKTAHAEFVQNAVHDWSISVEQAEALADAPLVGGWMRFSEKVIERMLPELETGRGRTDVLKIFYPAKEFLLGENKDELPSHHRAMPDARNPVVIRCLNETRKVVNNLIRTYGKPDYIRIEMARDIKLVGKKKTAALKKNSARKKARDKAKKWLQENNHASSDWNILKHMLWEESNHRCLYSGDNICAGDLFERGKYQIEHIMPRARSRDDSYNNLTLCREDLNRKKSDHTPFEAFGQSDEWDNMVKRVTEKVLKFPAEKIKRFQRKEYRGIEGDNERANSQLSDTAYAARLVRDFVAQLYPKGEAIDWATGRPPRVQVVNGQITSQLGRAWGVYREFNKQFIASTSNKKIRDDHRHHALDAVIIALTTPGLVNYLSSRYNEQRKHGKCYEEIMERLVLPRPWPRFHEDLTESLRAIVVSYRTDAKVNGKLTEDKHIGVQSLADGAERLVKRIDLKSAKAGDVRAIIDPYVKNIVWQHVRHFDETKLMPEHADTSIAQADKSRVNKAIGEAVKKAFADDANLPRMDKNGVAGAGPVIRRVRIEVTQQLHLTIPVHNKTVVLKGDNHHVALYCMPNGKIHHLAVSKLEGMRRVQSSQPIVSPTHPKHQEAKLKMSLVKRDVLERTDPDTGEITYWRVDIIGEKQVTLYLHTDAAKATKWNPSYGEFIKNGISKVSVDPIGRVRQAK